MDTHLVRFIKGSGTEGWSKNHSGMVFYAGMVNIIWTTMVKATVLPLAKIAYKD